MFRLITGIEGPKKEILPRYSVRDELVIDLSDAPFKSEIELAVSGVPVTQLRRCHLLFWNAGRLPLKASDIVGPISLEFSGSVIGQVKSVASRDVCKPRAEVNGNRIELTFHS